MTTFFSRGRSKGATARKTRWMPGGLARVRAYNEAWQTIAIDSKRGTEEQRYLFDVGVPERDVLEAIIELDERTR